LFATRLTSDGEIVGLYKDNTQVGAIGSASGGMYLGSGSSGAERMRIDSSGNVGIGVTPSATWGSDKAIQIGTSSNTSFLSSGDTSGAMNLGKNAYSVGSSPKYVGNGYATNYYQSAGTHVWQTAASNAGGAGAALTWSSNMTLDTAGNLQMQTGAVMPYAPAPAAISAAATLTNANIQGQIISATGTTYTITMPLGTTLETLATWATTNIAYDFFVINTASGTVTMAANTGVTTLGTLTIATGVSAHFRIRRTAANTFVLYRLV
jgi:hypothetical protein